LGTGWILWRGGHGWSTTVNRTVFDVPEAPAALGCVYGVALTV
jgi:hypothetical protein